jgi:hypothetical protein
MVERCTTRILHFDRFILQKCEVELSSTECIPNRLPWLLIPADPGSLS